MPAKLQFPYSCEKERSKTWMLKWDTKMLALEWYLPFALGSAKTGDMLLS